MSSTSSRSLSSSSASSLSSVCQLPEHMPNAVHLNIYDVLTPSDPATIPRLNSMLHPLGVGIFHTGVEVWGREFAFGGHIDDDSGIFEVLPRKCPAVKYRKSVCLGITKVMEKDVKEILEFLGETEYVGNRYCLISRNCNTFSRHLSQLLGVGDQFPNWVNRLAGIAVNIKCILPEGVDEPIGGDDLATPLLNEPTQPPPIAVLR